MSDRRLTPDQVSFLERLKNYKANGVRILIDGRELPEIEWDKIFMLADRTADGSTQFYMSDYVTGEDGDIDEIRLDKFQIRSLNC
jgi:hypothetical protein